MIIKLLKIPFRIQQSYSVGELSRTIPLLRFRVAKIRYKNYPIPVKLPVNYRFFTGKIIKFSSADYTTSSVIASVPKAIHFFKITFSISKKLLYFAEILI